MSKLANEMHINILGRYIAEYVIHLFKLEHINKASGNFAKSTRALTSDTVQPLYLARSEFYICVCFIYLQS